MSWTTATVLMKITMMTFNMKMKGLEALLSHRLHVFRPLQHFSYINLVVYPLTSIPLIAYCAWPAVCLLTGKFIILR